MFSLAIAHRPSRPDLKCIQTCQGKFKFTVVYVNFHVLGLFKCVKMHYYDSCLLQLFEPVLVASVVAALESSLQTI